MFDFEINIHGARVIVVRTPLCAGCHSDGEIDANIEALNRDGRLHPIVPPKSTALGDFITKYHLGDPQDTRDSWRPHRRRERLYRELRVIDASKDAGAWEEAPDEA